MLVFAQHTGHSFNDYLSHPARLALSLPLHFSHSLVCWWLFWGWEGGRPWPQAEGLITVLAREQKAEGAGGMKGWGRGGRGWRDLGP